MYRIRLYRAKRIIVRVIILSCFLCFPTVIHSAKGVFHEIETGFLFHPKVEVPIDRKTEENIQKSVDEGHSPWRLDPVFVSPVFVSLNLLPQGIVGDYPVKTEELELILNTGREAIVEVHDTRALIKKVYLKKLVRQDETGIWTVIGYDPVIS